MMITDLQACLSGVFAKKGLAGLPLAEIVQPGAAEAVHWAFVQASEGQRLAPPLKKKFKKSLITLLVFPYFVDSVVWMLVRCLPH